MAKVLIFPSYYAIDTVSSGFKRLKVSKNRRLPSKKILDKIHFEKNVDHARVLNPVVLLYRDLPKLREAKSLISKIYHINNSKRQNQNLETPKTIKEPHIPVRHTSTYPYHSVQQRMKNLKLSLPLKDALNSPQFHEGRKTCKKKVELERARMVSEIDYSSEHGEGRKGSMEYNKAQTGKNELNSKCSNLLLNQKSPASRNNIGKQNSHSQQVSASPSLSLLDQKYSTQFNSPRQSPLFIRTSRFNYPFTQTHTKRYVLDLGKDLFFDVGRRKASMLDLLRRLRAELWIE